MITPTLRSLILLMVGLVPAIGVVMSQSELLFSLWMALLVAYVFIHTVELIRLLRIRFHYTFHYPPTLHVGHHGKITIKFEARTC